MPRLTSRLTGTCVKSLEAPLPFVARKKTVEVFKQVIQKECSTFNLMTIVAMSTLVSTQPQDHTSISLVIAMQTYLSVTVLEQVRKMDDAYKKEREEYFIRKFDTLNRGINKKIQKSWYLGRFLSCFTNCGGLFFIY